MHEIIIHVLGVTSLVIDVIVYSEYTLFRVSSLICPGTVFSCWHMPAAVHNDC